MRDITGRPDRKARATPATSTKRVRAGSKVRKGVAPTKIVPLSQRNQKMMVKVKKTKAKKAPMSLKRLKNATNNVKMTVDPLKSLYKLTGHNEPLVSKKNTVPVYMAHTTLDNITALNGPPPLPESRGKRLFGAVSPNSTPAENYKKAEDKIAAAIKTNAADKETMKTLKPKKTIKKTNKKKKSKLASKAATKSGISLKIAKAAKTAKTVKASKVAKTAALEKAKSKSKPVKAEKPAKTKKITTALKKAKGKTGKLKGSGSRFSAGSRKGLRSRGPRYPGRKLISKLN